MNALSKLSLFALSLVLLSLAGCGGDETAAGRRPNVVLVVVDTLRSDMILDPTGVVDTPCIDRLVEDGVGFARAYAHAPMTLPSHTSLFSSRPPVETGVLNNRQFVPEDLPLLAEWIAGFGYSTRAVISLGTLTPPGGNKGLRRGFEKYDTNFFNLDKAEDVQPRLRAGLESWPAFNGTEDRPFFLFAHYCDPHEPYRLHSEEGASATIRLDNQVLGQYRLSDAPNLKFSLELDAGEHAFDVEASEEGRMMLKALRLVSKTGDRMGVVFEEGDLFERLGRLRAKLTVPEEGEYLLRVWMHDVIDKEEARRRYIAEVEHVDSFVGDLLDILKEWDNYDDTLIVFVSDHGEALGERGSLGHVQHLNDAMIHVPLVIKPAGGEDALDALRRRAEEPVSLMDITPTILSACGLPPLPGQRGASLLEPERERPFEHVAETHKPEAKEDRVSLFDGRLRMVYIPDRDRFYLYDLESDPKEENNVFEERSGERPDWPDRLRTIAERAAAITAGDEGSGTEHEDTLKALGYGG